MSIVAGVDFGTLSVRVSLFESSRGRLGSGAAGYSLKRSRDDPDQATQRHADQMIALELAMQEAIAASGISGHEITALSVDATGSSVIPVNDRLEPIDSYYLWCDHRAWREAREITDCALAQKLEAIRWCGGSYSSEWGFSKLLYWLRHQSQKRSEFATMLENCDMVVATLCGISDPELVPRSVCAMGHKWMWNPKWGGLPSQEFLSSIDPLFEGVRDKLGGNYRTADQIAGELSPEWARRLGLRKHIPIPHGGLDAHWDAIGANIRLGDVVNVIGTSTCMIGVSDSETLVPGVCGVVPGSVLPRHTGIEAGMSAVGDLFSAIARRAGADVATLSHEHGTYRAGQTGLLRVPWDNGDRTVLVNPLLAGVTLGWNLLHTAADELFAAIEGTALQTRIILQRMQEFGVPVERLINSGGIPQRNEVLNRIYANALRKPVMVPKGDVTSLGSAIFAFLAAGEFRTVGEGQDALCPPFETYFQDEGEADVYDDVFVIFRDLYFALGQVSSAPRSIGHILPALREAARTRTAKGFL